MRRALFQGDLEVIIERCRADRIAQSSHRNAGCPCGASDADSHSKPCARPFRRSGHPRPALAGCRKQPARSPSGGLPDTIACRIVHSRTADAAPVRRASGYTPPARWEKRPRTSGSLPKAQFARNRSGLIPPRVHHSGEIGRPPQKCRAASTPKGQEAQRRERPSPRDLRYVLPNSQAKEQRGERGFESAQAVSPRAPAGLRRWAGTPSLRQMTPAHVPDSGFRDPSRRLAA